IQQPSHEREREFEIACRQRTAQLENDSGARKRHELADTIDLDFAFFAKEDVDLLQLVLDLARVAAGQQNEEIERVVIELQFPLLRAATNDFGRFLLPATTAGVEPIKNLHLRPFNQGLIKRAPLVHFRGAD